MSTDDVVDIMIEAYGRAAHEVVVRTINRTPDPLRPVALAAMRMTLDSIAAALTEEDREQYAKALESISCTTIRLTRKERKDD